MVEGREKGYRTGYVLSQIRERERESLICLGVESRRGTLFKSFKKGSYLIGKGLREHIQVIVNAGKRASRLVNLFCKIDMRVFSI